MNRINKISWHLLMLPIVFAVLYLPGCEEVQTDPDSLTGIPADTTRQVTEQDSLVSDSTVHTLLNVIMEDNFWGGSVIREVDRVMSLLKTTRYTLTNYITDVENGRLEVDCSKYVETILKEVSEIHYAQLPKSSRSGLTSLAKDYYNHFITLPTEPDGIHCWIRVPSLEDARPGDLISYIHDEGGNTTGHVMIICAAPDPSVFSPADMSVVVNDAANSGHFEDSRNAEGPYASDYQYIAEMYYTNGVFKFSGVGIGTMWFHLGDNDYYRWSSPSGTIVYKQMAIGRLIDIPTTSVH